jgi:CelD/BcsL family acetyltransferase involved in cellulose biosynthesis
MVERYDSIAPLAAEWDDLADRCSAMPWLRPGWFAAWWRAFGRGRLAILTLRRRDLLAGVLPLALRAGVRASPTNWHTPEFAPLAEGCRDHEDLARALLAGRLRRVDLRFIAPEDRGLAACRSAALAARCRVLERTLESSPFVEIRGSWESYAATKRGAFLADMRRRRRRLEEQGSVTIEIAEGSERLDALLDDGFRVEGSGWKTAQGTAIASRPETEHFYREIARWAADRGWLQLAFLRLDGHAVAFHFNLVAQGVHYNLKGGYDPGYARFAPSRLLHRELIERAFRQRLRSYEFLGAEEAWKLEWTSTTRDRRIFQAFPRAPVGTVELAAFAYGRPLASRVLAWAHEKRNLESARGAAGARISAPERRTRTAP